MGCKRPERGEGMSGTVVKRSELVRRAIAWVTERRLREPELKIGHLLSEAGARFNLSPAEQEQLQAMLGGGEEKEKERG